MSLSRLSVVTLSLMASLVLFGCASTAEKDVTQGWSPNKLYAEAMDERTSGNFEKATTYFEKLEGRAAGTMLAQQAQLEKAFTQYRAGEKPQAQVTLDRFMRLHPSSPAMDYALYLKGIINFNDNLGMFSFLSRQDLSERDQKGAKDSFEAFSELVSRFPDSRYAPDARLRLTYIFNALAQYEVHVARYYYSRGAYVAAIERAQTAVSQFRDAPALEEALAIMVQSYEALGMESLRDDTRRVLDKNFPGSTFLTRGLPSKDGPWWKIW